MERGHLLELLLQNPPTPCFVVDEGLLERNLAVLDSVQRRTGARILLALKGFAMFSVFPLLRGTLHGVCASSPHEARLGREEFGREVHAFAAGYSEADMRELVELCDHISFNSFAQYRRFRPMIEAAPARIECSIRVNPEHSEGAVPIYDPCSPGSRLGVRRRHFEPDALDGISGLHFHTLCEQNSDSLERTLDAFEAKFGEFLHGMKWLNMGGGHHITRADYDVDLLCRLIDRVRTRYDVDVYLEPGEAVALNTGFLVATVLDVIEADMPIAILDASAAAHMPDVLEMPYRPGVVGSGLPGEKAWTCRLAGHSCLAGDVIGEYSFEEALKPGDRLVFTDMAHYSMVKTNTFNGLKLPSIALWRRGEALRVIREFGYENYRNRLS
ncbi:carboxynorspermidine decarboxylase [Desulfobaculum xiamenense]|uniref:Carboxynorspermidine/carboxyspermidine decarboxylase n=1 Tax=Desulfobaculum xiamenense TaxID=995050 RepID=A0A846QJN3_9BACT|nr:carboxynorspermidine decarboxylase [Desulfobaculum xiamenense]NJB67280.1 carboxynorspermidine decarboxylase [Desulfobaculum xiamenense]